MSKILKLNPYISDKIWGYEKWNLSTHKNGNSIVEGTNKTLKDTIGKDMPILIKIIKADESLSVQVHPNDEYANKYESDNGKTECWYILDANEDATLICGIREGLNKESFEKIIEDNKIEECLQRISVKKGDMVYIPAGTVHAIEGGIRLLEVQQSSDVTYRLYDWGRDRDTHIKKSLDVIDYKGESKAGKIENFKELVTSYFKVEKICVIDEFCSEVEEDFHSITAINGCGRLECGCDFVELPIEETIYIPNGIKYVIKGNVEIIRSY